MPDIAKGLDAEVEEVFTLSPIAVPSRFAGRKEGLAYCRNKMKAGVVCFVIYGEVGVGKSSFSRVLLSDRDPFLYTAGSTTDLISIFLSVLTRIGENFTDAEVERLEKLGYKFGLDQMSVERGTQVVTKSKPIVEQTLDLNLLLEKLVRRQDDIGAIIVDDFHRVADDSVRLQLLEVVKGLADRSSSLVIAITGIADSDEDLVGCQEYTDYLERHITPFKVGRMNRADLLEILSQRQSIVDVESAVAESIVHISSGFPARVHQLGQAATMHWLSQNLANAVKNVVKSVRLIRRIAEALGASEETLELKDVGVKIGYQDLDAAVRTLLIGYANDRSAMRDLIDDAATLDAGRRLLRALSERDQDEIPLAELLDEANLKLEETATVADLIRDGGLVRRDKSATGAETIHLVATHARVYLRALEYTEKRMAGHLK